MTVQETPHWWRSPYIVLLAAGITMAISMGVRQTLGLFLDPLSQATGVSLASISLAIAFQNLIWGVATPMFGALADRYGGARFLLLGSLLYALGLVITAYADSGFMIHLGAGVTIGFGVAAMGMPLVMSAVARVAPLEKQSLWLGIASTGGSVGQFLLLPGSQMMIERFGWSLALVGLALISLIVVPLTASLAGKAVSKSATANDQSLSEAVKEAKGHSGYWLLTAGFFVCGFHVSFVATHLPGYIVSCNLSAAVGAQALGLVGLFNIFGGLLAGWLGGIYRKKYLLTGIYFARAVVISLFILAPKTELAVYLFSASFGLLWLSTVPLTSALVGQIFGARYLATLFGVVLMGHQVGAFFGAWFGGISVDMTGSYDSVWWISVALALLAAALHWPITDKPLRDLAPA
ncbi:MFS transporter [Rhodovibrionaceae bacterium A322]